jgi:preprotein translocase subunit YajC
MLAAVRGVGIVGILVIVLIVMAIFYFMRRR